MRIKLIIFLSVFSLLGVFGVQQLSAQTKYAFVYGWIKEGYGDDKKTTYFVSNIVKIDCNYAPDDAVKSQFGDYYKASYRNKFGKSSFVDWSAANTYDTRDKAEKARREQVAEYTERGNFYQFSDFRYLCDE